MQHFIYGINFVEEQMGTEEQKEKWVKRIFS